MSEFKPLRFVVLTDLHLRERRGVEKFHHAVEQINALPGIDFVLMLGDFVWDGPADELSALLRRFARPVHFIYGNNDRPRLAEYAASLGPMHHYFEHGNCLFVGLWNCVMQAGMGDHQGGMDAAQIAWTEHVLKRASERQRPYEHLFLFAHSPLRRNWREPAKYWMTPELSERWLDWCERFRVSACFFGHVHADEVFAVGGTKMITTASLNWNFDVKDDSIQPFWQRKQCEWGRYRIVSVSADGIRHESRRLDWSAILARVGAGT